MTPEAEHPPNSDGASEGRGGPIPPAGPPVQTLGELALLIRRAAAVVREEGDSRRACSLVAQARASARKLRPILELVLGKTQAEEFFEFEVRKILRFTEVHADGIAAGEVFWGGDHGAADKLARRLEEWAERVDLLTAAEAERAQLGRQTPMPVNGTGHESATARQRATSAQEAVAMLKDEWATYEELAHLTGRTTAAIRSAIKRAKDEGKLTKQDVQPIPDTRPRMPRVRVRIRGVWPHLFRESERSRERTDS